MKVLVTGSSGHVGSKIAERVAKHGNCVGVDLVPGRYTTHLGNITNKIFMREVISGVDAIIHAAAYHATHVGVIAEDEFRHVNVQDTELLLDLAIQKTSTVLC